MIIGMGVPIASTAPAPGGERLVMVDIPAETARVLQPMPTPEELLLRSLQSLRAGNTDLALMHVDRLIDQKPTFRLAHLVRGDILASVSGRMPSIVEADKKFRPDIDNMIAEARQRIVGTSFKPTGTAPAALLQLADHHRHVVFIDTDLSRLYLFANHDGIPELVADYYISVGKNGSRKRCKGDKRTPLGVYFVTERLRGEDLPDRYGPVAFPVNYPNEWDSRHQRTGSGIWLHGVASKSYSRPPQDSDGCVALINEEIMKVSPLIEPGRTPVVIGSGEDWVDYSELQQRRDEMRAAVEQWRMDWQSGDVDRYLSHYAEDFQGRGMDIDAWRAYKRRIAKYKKDVSVELSHISIYGYPDERNMIVVTFRQHYESNNFNGNARKRQYWRKSDDGNWRIVTETTATIG